MARFTKRGIFTALSVLYLLALTILGSFALYQANHFSLPMSQTVPALVVATPPLTGILYEAIISFKRKAGTTHGALQASAFFQAVTAVLLVFETSLATLVGIHISPVAGLQCPLREQWSMMRSDQDERGIRRIQDAFDCCGFQSTKDMAWPFEGKMHGVDACVRMTERERACVGPWMAMERKVAIMMLTVLVGVFVWKAIMIFAPSMNTMWSQSSVQLPDDDLNSRDDRRHREIGYRDAEEHADDASVTNEVNRLNQEVGRANLTDSRRVYASPLIREQDIEAWRRS